MAKWRRCTNTLEEFIHDACEQSAAGEYRRSNFYSDYTSWCSENGRKPFSKGRVKELLEHNIGLGIRLVELNGHETFRGITVKAKPTSRSYAASTTKVQPLQPSPVSADDITSIPSTPETGF